MDTHERGKTQSLTEILIEMGFLPNETDNTDIFDYHKYGNKRMFLRQVA